MKAVYATAAVAVVCVAVFVCLFVAGVFSPPTQVHITAGKIEPGMTAKDVQVAVTIDDQPVSCRVKLTAMAWDGYREMEDDEPVPEDFSIRLDIYYSLPKGCDVSDIQVTLECDGGKYDGTGSISNDAEGNVEAWSRVYYGQEPVAPTEPTSPPETEPTTPPETEPTAPPATEPTTPPATEPTPPPHTHEWVELPGPGILFCTMDGVKNFECSCGQTKSETIPAPGHDLKEWSVTPATCTSDGRKTSSCNRCAAGFIVELPATGHDWSDWEKKTGLVHSHTCTVCGAEEEEDHNIPAGSVTCTECGADIIN